MVQATCIQKFRDKHNNIYGYRIKDTSGKTLDVKSDSLKNAIKNKQIHITNLTLTSDNRLIDVGESKNNAEYNTTDNKQTVVATALGSIRVQSLGVVGYTLLDAHGCEKDFKSETIIAALKNGTMRIDNLQLTANNELTKIGVPIEKRLILTKDEFLEAIIDNITGTPKKLLQKTECFTGIDKNSYPDDISTNFSVDLEDLSKYDIGINLCFLRVFADRDTTAATIQGKNNWTKCTTGGGQSSSITLYEQTFDVVYDQRHKKFPFLMRSSKYGWIHVDTGHESYSTYIKKLAIYPFGTNTEAFFGDGMDYMEIGELYRDIDTKKGIVYSCEYRFPLTKCNTPLPPLTYKWALEIAEKLSKLA